jgi:hypothetical protein
MSEWMEYLYQQRPLPTDATGVTVKLTAHDTENWDSVIEIGTTTCDFDGNFEFLWTPPQTGFYEIEAEFEGTASYGPSSAETAVAIMAASAQPTTQPTQSPTQAPTDGPTQTPSQTTAPASPTPAVEPESDFPTETLLIVGAAVVIIAVIGAAALVLRKRK